jgi:mono/diheme cytochrome c family protein
MQMKNDRVRISRRAVRLAAVCGAAAIALTGYQLTASQSPAFAGRTARAATAPLGVTVTLGRPSETSLSLSKSKVSLKSGQKVSFVVRNKGKLAHGFRVCSGVTTASKATAKSCAGPATKLLKPGTSATLLVTLKAGNHEYLPSTASQAAKGTKGIMKVTVATSSGSPGTTTTAPTTTTPTLTGYATAGAPVWVSSGCGGCHTLAAAASTGTLGPNLDDSKPTSSVVILQVTNGGSPMPAFGNQLTPQQIADLAAYVVASTSR